MDNKDHDTVEFVLYVVSNSSKQSQNSYLAVFLLDVFPRHTNIMAGKEFNIFFECTARGVHHSPQEECTSSSWGDSKSTKMQG